jgi:methylmalonyl-CoA decarboxylase subunit alpha
MNGDTIGFVANQPLVLAGVLDVDSSDKAARFIGIVMHSIFPL